MADTEADAANDSVRGNLRVLSVLATWGPPTSNHEPAHASTTLVSFARRFVVSRLIDFFFPFIDVNGR